MKITATISNYNETDDILEEEGQFKLTNFPISEYIFDTPNNSYKVCQTLVIDKNTHSDYNSIEQVLLKIDNSKTPKNKYYFLQGKITFEENEENLLFKTVKVVRGGVEIAPICILYSYLRPYDCIQESNTVYRIEHIKVSEELIIKLDLFSPPVHIKEYRKNAVNYCRGKAILNF